MPPSESLPIFLWHFFLVTSLALLTVIPTCTSVAAMFSLTRTVPNHKTLLTFKTQFPVQQHLPAASPQSQLCARAPHFARALCFVNYSSSCCLKTTKEKVLTAQDGSGSRAQVKKSLKEHNSALLSKVQSYFCWGQPALCLVGVTLLCSFQMQLQQLVSEFSLLRWLRGKAVLEGEIYKRKE